MKYLWIGMGISPEQKEQIIKNGGKILSANVSQDAILDGLEQNGVFCDTINTYGLSSYPRYKEKHIPEYNWTRNGITVDKSVGYPNYKYISHYFKSREITKACRAWAQAHKNEQTTIFIYSMHSPFLDGAVAAKKHMQNAKIVLIVPDLPQYMDLAMSPLKKFLKALDWQKIKSKIKHVDKFILYSKHMADFLDLKEGTWTVMEGSFDLSSLVEETVEKNEDKISIMYSGVVDMRYGIPQLLDAMQLLDDRFELWLTGGGNAAGFIKERALRDKRIRYFGFLPSRKDLLLKQKEATMLISTRRPDEPASAFCFPSKLFEYMISGNPVLSCRIKGIPEEYFDYLIEMKSTEPAEIAKAIQQVADMSSAARKERGEAGKQFVLKEKNNVVQAEKILAFVNEVIE
ncbi:MAG: glycosyltransferase [Clostridia bacterium]|nr:glycosyltransferase [Clostridia bacterium]